VTTAAQPGRVLLVDDDDGVLRTLARLLKRLGHVVETAHDGRTATGALQNGAFDVVLSDISMPGMNGIELLLALRQIDLDVPIVLMTGAPEVATAARAVEFGAMRYLTKPLDLDELERVIDQAVRLCRLARVRRQALQLVGNVHKFVGDRAGLEARFKKALDTLWMAYQPIVSVANQSVYAYEALVRNGEPTLASPLALLAAAAQLGRLHDLGRAIRKAVADAARAAACKLFVNLHALDFTDAELFSTDAPLSRFAGDVVLEITERESLDQIKDVRSDLKKLRAMGYRIAVDDLGAGYAGLTSLPQLQPEVVKIDMSLVRDVHQEPTKRALVGMMVGVAREMKMAVVAEGVETAAERDVLIELGCDLLQGYLFAKPGQPFPSVSWQGG
jgi:EAL domain-containing protein (putative c-di-GMP-specific phosphodiesterase class I)/ActR/RegA family two-component response regulator